MQIIPFTVYKRIIYTFLVCILSMSSVSAQLQMNVGYDFTYFNFKGLNNVIDTYNTSNPNNVQKLEHINIMNGGLLGLRYNLGFIGIEASWIYRFGDKKAILNESGSSTESIRLQPRFQTFSFAVDNTFDWLSYGASLDYNLYKIQSKSESNVKTSLFSDDDVYLTPYIGFNSRSGGLTTICIRPFVRIPIVGVDFKDLDKKWNGSNNTEDTKTNPLMFGVKIIIKNGYSD